MFRQPILPMSYFDPIRLAGRTINTLALFSKHAAGKLAFTIFCTPKAGKVFTKKERQFLDQAQQKQIPFQSTHLQVYTWEGAGKTVLLAHGYESNTARWRPLVRFLNGKGYKVIAFDAPAHGASGGKTVNGVLYAEAMAAVLKHHAVDFVVGHSLGGMAAIYYFSHLATEAVDKLILMAVPSELSTVIDFYYKVLQLNQRSQKAMETYFQQYIGFNIDYFSASQFIKKVEIPGLLILDKNDEIALFEESKAISECWPQGYLFVTEGLGHSLQGRSVYKTILETIMS